MSHPSIYAAGTISFVGFLFFVAFALMGVIFDGWAGYLKGVLIGLSLFVGIALAIGVTALVSIWVGGA